MIRIIGEYYKQLYGNKLDNVAEKFPKRYNLPKLTQEEIEKQNKPTEEASKIFYRFLLYLYI